MSANGSGGADDRDAGSWATESLPLSVRKELLERELSKLGFRKRGGSAAAGHDGAVAQQQQQPQGGGHPQADTGSDSSDHSG
jgi:hypothetical protein